MTSNQRTSSQANVCSEQEFENLLRRSEEHLKSLRPGVSKSDSLQPNSLKLVPPIRRRDSAA
ncbi:MAG TPA: hypothetical protein VNO32_31920 [Candidatus Acidoferrum sp.]|nr:hypothetical protein [Candidatus Acidoferrum sp.]